MWCSPPIRRLLPGEEVQRVRQVALFGDSGKAFRLSGQQLSRNIRSVYIPPKESIQAAVHIRGFIGLFINLIFIDINIKFELFEKHL